MALPKTYQHQKVENKIYNFWLKTGLFNPDKLPPRHKKPFTIIMPPPNANAPLHMGHAVFITLEDIMIRYQRMKGKKTLWLPGADHAGFETQVVYDKKLEKEGKDRFQIPSQQLYQEILDFTLKNKKIMESQLKKMGASCDWSRKKFTLDPAIIKIVYQTFEKLKKDGLIYQGKRIINWCPKHQTSLSDVETKYETRTDPLYYMKYGPIEVATVRLETQFGDTAIAVNPNDPRYQKYIGQELEVDTLLGKKKLKVIADKMVDPKFGSGAVKVTPAHDPVDFEIWQRHSQEIPGPIQVIDKFGRLNELTGPYQGMKIKEAREKIAQDMAKKELLDPNKTDYQYQHNVALCYKCGSIIEPMILDNQWFIKMTAQPKSGKLSLRDLALKAVNENKVVFIPPRFKKVFCHWMKNLRDWNISRQIVWGIPIPNDPAGQVFDTWFSSGQWPFATLQASPGQRDFKKFYPTDIMETGWDILFFWVARMIMLGLYATGRVPFKYVYLHGLVRDKERQKMSKSKGNVIDPLGVATLYGTDAVRMALVVGNTPGNDIIIFEEKIRGYRNFANKIWNASRFVLMNLKDYQDNKKTTLSAKDKKHLKQLKKLVKEINKLMDSFRFYAAAEKIYHYFWHTFCDKIIESQKQRLNRAKERKKAQKLLLETLLINLKLLHPFMPFITEEIYQKLPLKNKKESIMIENWPR
ncbi:MAG: class I tRNA ligase family protein [Minisyncoccales bacterium]